MTVLGADGLMRCPWGSSAPDYVAYHDEEWGRPVCDDRGLYERLCLEAFQSGLSWLTILRKRPGFRRAFDDFEPEKVAAYGTADVERLLTDVSIVRNRRKIDATIANARASLDLPEGLAALVWKYADRDAPAPKTVADVPATTPGSQALAKELKGRDFRHVGPTTVYALMQACGLVDDHLLECHRRGAYTVG
ncbi:MAG TPA: DNA-3-methyladenine glycosylase I [Actinoallomurus sp.]|jgi:DNA-3-methyladenine glycosylase I